MRAYELRATGITFDETATGFLRAAVPAGVINVIANEPDERDEREYRAKWQEEREVSRVPEDEPAVFLEVSVADASEFEADLEIRGEERFGYKVLTVSSAAVPNGIAAICLAMRDEFGLIPLDRGQPADAVPALHPVGLGRGRAGHPRDPAPSRTRPVPPPARTRGLRTGRTPPPRITSVSFPGPEARPGHRHSRHRHSRYRDPRHRHGRPA
jgi:hypothetical protein